MAEIVRLTVDDRQFIDWVNAEINSATAISFELPDNVILRVIDKTARWSWEWLYNSTQLCWLGIRSSDIMTARQDGMNAAIRLPDYVESINDFKLASASFGSSIEDLIRNSAVRTYSSSFTGAASNGATTTSGFSERMADSVVQLYAFSAANQVFAREVSHNYNKATHILNIYGACQSDIIMLIEKRLDFKDLYQIFEFRELVVAECMSRLGNLLGTFKFNLPGAVQIDFDMIHSEGKDKLTELKEEIKSANGNSTTLFKH